MTSACLKSTFDELCTAHEVPLSWSEFVRASLQCFTEFPKLELVWSECIDHVGRSMAHVHDHQLTENSALFASNAEVLQRLLDFMPHLPPTVLAAVLQLVVILGKCVPGVVLARDGEGLLHALMRTVPRSSVGTAHVVVAALRNFLRHVDTSLLWDAVSSSVHSPALWRWLCEQLRAARHTTSRCDVGDVSMTAIWLALVDKALRNVDSGIAASCRQTRHLLESTCAAAQCLLGDGELSATQQTSLRGFLQRAQPLLQDHTPVSCDAYAVAQVQAFLTNQSAVAAAELQDLSRRIAVEEARRDALHIADHDLAEEGCCVDSAVRRDFGPEVVSAVHRVADLVVTSSL